jgi:hypothetical protein
MLEFRVVESFRELHLRLLLGRARSLTELFGEENESTREDKRQGQIKFAVPGCESRNNHHAPGFLAGVAGTSAFE